MADAPRLAYPLRLHASGATVVEQDTLDDLISTAFYALRTPPGWRDEAPGFGVADMTFELNPVEEIVAQLQASDARLRVLPDAERDQLTLRIRLHIGSAV